MKPETLLRIEGPAILAIVFIALAGTVLGAYGRIGIGAAMILAAYILFSLLSHFCVKAFIAVHQEHAP